jgi:hypothetical protein
MTARSYGLVWRFDAQRRADIEYDEELRTTVVDAEMTLGELAKSL